MKMNDWRFYTKESNIRERINEEDDKMDNHDKKRKNREKEKKKTKKYTTPITWEWAHEEDVRIMAQVQLDEGLEYLSDQAFSR